MRPTKQTSRTAACGATEAQSRLSTARAYLDVADLALDETRHNEYLNVSAGLAVLSGIAASDAICCRLLGRRHRGENHRGAPDLLKQATADGPQLANDLSRLLDLKDEAHYGVLAVSTKKARDAVKWARRLVERAQQEMER